MTRSPLPSRPYSGWDSTTLPVRDEGVEMMTMLISRIGFSVLALSFAVRKHRGFDIRCMIFVVDYRAEH
jgi:hypothetical protein